MRKAQLKLDADWLLSTLIPSSFVGIPWHPLLEFINTSSIVEVIYHFILRQCTTCLHDFASVCQRVIDRIAPSISCSRLWPPSRAGKVIAGRQ